MGCVINSSCLHGVGFVVDALKDIISAATFADMLIQGKFIDIVD